MGREDWWLLGVLGQPGQLGEIQVNERPHFENQLDATQRMVTEVILHSPHSHPCAHVLPRHKHAPAHRSRHLPHRLGKSRLGRDVVEATSIRGHASQFLSSGPIGNKAHSQDQGC